MFLFSRRLHLLTTHGRAHYSSFFSNKAGGGRNAFNSAKPPKSVVAPNSTTSSKDPPSSSVEASSGDGVVNTTTTRSSSSNPSNESSSSSSSSPSKPPNNPASSHDPPHPKLTTTTTTTTTPAPPFSLYHPPVDPKDFKLHQFFSLQRPLLLLRHPTSTIFDSPSSLPPTNPFASLFTSSTDHYPDSNRLTATIDNPPESTPEADADAARHLGRAFVMNHVGCMVEWEATLRHLGIDVDLDEDRAGSKEQCEKEWKDIMLESTKRKRRSKMKKHKLKKRRRATRSQRLKIGR